MTTRAVSSVVAALALAATILGPAQAATPALVQLKYATPQTNQASVPVTFTSPQTAGNTNIVAIGWSDATSNITSVTDSAGNSYQLAAPIRRGTNLSQAIYYASNIAAAASKTVTVAFSASVPYADVRIAEYAGIASSNPIDGTSSNSGTSTAPSSGSVTTTTANALLFGAGMTHGGFTAAGSGFTTRVITSPDGDIVEDRIVSSTGSYSATATSTNSAWVMQVVAFKGASPPPPPPPPPTGTFEAEILAIGFNKATSMAFLPDGRMLVAEMPGTIRILSAPYLQASPTPFLQLTDITPPTGGNGLYGLTNLSVDPNFATNHYFYVTYTLGSALRTRISRFTANANTTGTVPGSEFVLYQDPGTAGPDHHGGAVVFGNDGKIYFTTGEEVTNPADAQSLTSPRGKIHRINPDGTVPTDNPFYDGNGPNVDSIWALGLRNPFRAYYDAPTGRLYVGDVGGNNYSTAVEEIDLGARGANYAWPNCQSSCASPPYTNPLYSYTHDGRDAAIVSGFVYHGSQFPSSYQGSYFFADYAQNWIRRLTLDANGNVTGLFNFMPSDGSLDGDYGDIVCLTEGPDGALYYVDIGYNDTSGQFTYPSKIRRIRFVGSSNQPPIAASSADRTTGPAPLTVNFSSAGSSDPEGQPLSYAWDLGDSTTSTASNPTHTYTQPGQYTIRLTVSDGTNSTLAAPLGIRVGNPPTATILTPQDGATFRAGDVISFSGNATDPEDGTLPASAYAWNIDFLHENHVHPGAPVTGVKSGTFTIPTSGHDFSGNTRYQISLTVTDSDGLTNTQSVIVRPQKVNLTLNTAPSGLTLYLDGIAYTTPFVHDTLIGFNHTVEARNQTSGNTGYTFASWSDGGAQTHTVVVPASAQTYTATFTSSGAPPPISFVQLKYATPQTNQASVPVTFTSPQTAGNTNIVAIGWSDATSNITSVTDSAGNSYQLAAPIRRGTNLSQAIYYASNIAAAASKTVTVAFSASVPYADVRIAEYAGIASSNPIDGTSSNSGTSTAPSSGSVTTTTANALLFGAGMTHGGFTAAGSGFTTRVITSPDGDIVEDRIVSSTGSYSATATSTNSAWVMQVVAFRPAGGSVPDTTPPTVAITSPAAGATVSGTTGVSANASDNVGVAGVQFLLDGANLGAEDTTAPYTTSWDTTAATNGAHVLTARARDASGNTTTSAAVGVTVSNSTPPPPPPPPPSSISFVQLKYATPQTNQASVPVTFTSPQTAGNTNIVAIGWSDATSNITSVTDSAGNSYQLAAPIRRGTNLSQAIYYASNIAAAASKTVTVAFSASVPYADVRIAEYAGIASSNPIDGTSSNSGTSTAPSSGSVTTTTANALLFGAGMTHGGFTAAGSGFTTRVITSPDGDIVEDRIVSSTGSYSATATSTNSAWVMQVVAFRPAGGSVPDTTPPTVAITSPAAGATVSGTTGVSANASDNVGVAGVQFLLDGANLGAEDTTAPYTTSWDTTAATNGAHVLTARARDASGNTTTSAAVGVTVSNSTPPPPPPPPPSSISFVQLKYATPQTNQASVPVTFTSPQTAGNTNIVAIGWSDATSNITSVTDSAGNSYQLAAPIRRGTNLSQAIYYASNIAAAASKTVTVAFSASVPYADVRIAEYAGIASSNPIDGTSSNSGTSTAPSSGSVTTTTANALLFGAGMTHGGFTAAGSGFTTRVITSPDGDIVEDRIVSSTGSYSATATSTNSAWVMQVVAFKGAT